MKKRIISLLLCAALLPAVLPAFAAGGSDDPLISQSYIADVFLPQITAALGETARAALAEQSKAQQEVSGNGLSVLTLENGDRLRLSSGQQMVLLSGSVKITVDSGRMLNVTAGRSSVGGEAREGNRYILCGNSSATVTASGTAAVAVSPAAVREQTGSPAGDCPFTDVPEGAWYRADVISAYERGLVNGVSAGRYDPLGTLTAGSAVKLAACMHQLYHTGSVTLKNAADGRAWYMSYVDYALKNGLIETEFQDYDGVINRGAFIKLFFNALPESEYPRINLIMDGSIPDVATDAPLAKQVYVFYMAGILTGFSEGGGYREHAFGPESTISRAEVAAIMNRMFDPAARKHFTMD